MRSLDVLPVRLRDRAWSATTRAAPPFGSTSPEYAFATLQRDLYDRAGVAEYWIVDPEIEIVKVYRRGASGRFERAAELAAERGERLESPLLPGLALPLAQLFAT